jgi:hypothetical protein
VNLARVDGLRSLCVALTVGTGLSLLAAAGDISQNPQLPITGDALRRARAYVVQYEDHQLSTVSADEQYDQQLLDAQGEIKTKRSLRAEYLLVQLPPDEDWFALRDVYQVDGEWIRDRSSRLEKLFEGPAADVTDRAMTISKESARFNLGDVYRTINVPTFPLRFLRPASRARFEFEIGGEETIGGIATRVITYRETKKPTFVATPEGRDVPASGRFWVSPDTGCIVRSEMIVGGTRDVPQRAAVTVTYRLEPSLGFWVPVEMQERYDNTKRRTADVITGQATYSSFRRFDSRSLRRSR